MPGPRSGRAAWYFLKLVRLRFAGHTPFQAAQRSDGSTYLIERRCAVENMTSGSQIIALYRIAFVSTFPRFAGNAKHIKLIGFCRAGLNDELWIGLEVQNSVLYRK